MKRWWRKYKASKMGYWWELKEWEKKTHLHAAVSQYLKYRIAHSGHCIVAGGSTQSCSKQLAGALPPNGVVVQLQVLERFIAVSKRTAQLQCRQAVCTKPSTYIA
jgi:hypothetical protein